MEEIKLNLDELFLDKETIEVMGDNAVGVCQGPPTCPFTCQIATSSNLCEW